MKTLLQNAFILVLLLNRFNYIFLRKSMKDDKIYDIDSFRTSLFKWHHSEGYYYVNLGLTKDDHVVGYVDFDTDNSKLSDLITYKKTPNSFDFYMNIYSESKAIFQQKSEPFFKIEETDLLITNVYTGPFVNDEKYGFVITVKSLTNQQYKTYFLNDQGSVFATRDISPILIADVNGDRNLEIIAYNSKESIRRI